MYLIFGGINLKIACGTDIIEIKRVKNAVNEIGEKFLHKIFSD